MRLPFSPDEFLGAFRSYNMAIGIAPALLAALAVALVVVAQASFPWRHRAIAAGLGLLWLWSGVVYHWGFFTRINPVAWMFGAVFVVQGILMMVGAVRGRLQIGPGRNPATVIGWLLITYALVVYPLAGWALGHGYPDGPSFGAPCPTVIYFVGMLFWTTGRIPVVLALVPIAWAVVGTSAATQLGMREDYGLAVAGLLLVTELARRRWSKRILPHAGVDTGATVGGVR